MQRQPIMDNRFMKPVESKRIVGGVLDISLNQVKEYLIITHNEDDAVIQRILDSVVERLEKYCKRPFTPTEITVYMDFCKNPLALPRLPIIELIDLAIKVERGYTGYEALALDDYEVFADEIILETTGIVYLKYKAGYSANELPESIKLAIYAEVAYRYENRGDKQLPADICQTAQEYLGPYIVTTYAI